MVNLVQSLVKNMAEVVHSYGRNQMGVYLFAWKLGFGLPAVWIFIAADNSLRPRCSTLYCNGEQKRNE
ncbi:MAG: hypothetical protein Q8935_10265 [Bacillota bacterium]|nr:hypothetical protein [Bacillota bacterium]